ncbi:MAG: aspartyl protease family protein [Bacteroidota bacterium]
MGTTTKRFLVKESRNSGKKIEVDFLIDSGAVYSLVPKELLNSIGLEPYRTVDFALADGTKITRQVGDAYFEYEGEVAPAPVIFGEEGDEPLLGVTTLKSLGLVLNPYKRELYPMRMLMM